MDQLILEEIRHPTYVVQQMLNHKSCTCVMVL